MSLNDEQSDYVRSLSENPHLACGCRWFYKSECEAYCPHPHNRLPEQTKINATRNLAYARVIETIGRYKDNFYPLKDIPEYEHPNQYRRNVRAVCDKLMKDISELVKE